MSEIDAWLEGFMHEQGSVALVLVVGLLLGLRHAADPDHLAAVTTLLASERSGDGRRRLMEAGLTGLSWGLGHGSTLVLVGLPLVLLGHYLPEVAVQTAEVAVGCIIVLLAVRLLVRWRRGVFHAHFHTHDGNERHRHVHSHADDPSHKYSHATIDRSLLSSYGVGLVHGIGGSGGLTLLLLSTFFDDKAQAAGVLLIFAAGTAVSMALLSIAFGLAIAGGPIGRNVGRVAPVLGVSGMAFGAWYAFGALGLAGYPF
jgi:ABC-type nickel/cobalt efflux system permease component RcnA